MVTKNSRNALLIGAINSLLVIIALLQALSFNEQTPFLQSTTQQLLAEGSLISSICFAILFFWTAKYLKKKYGRIWNSTNQNRPEDWLIVTIAVISSSVGILGYPGWVYSRPVSASTKQEIVMMRVVGKQYPSSSHSSWCRLKLRSLQNPQHVDTLIIGRTKCPNAKEVKKGTALRLVTVQKFNRYPIVLRWQLISSPKVLI